MTLDQALMLVIFLGTFAGLIRCQNHPERVFGVATLTCLAASFVTTEQVFLNAVNPGLMTLVLLVLCSFSFERTSVLRKVSSLLINGSKVKSSLRTLVLAALASGLMNNTAVVAALISTVKNNTLINPGRLLLPLSFAAVLGGTLTLVGTSTNLIVNSMLIEKGQPSLGFFDFTLVGLAALFCCFFVIFLRIPSLPRMAKQEFSQKHYFVEAEITAESKLIGKSVEENGLRNLGTLFLVEVVRCGRMISPVTPEEVLQAGDKLIFSGDISQVFVLKQFDGLELYAQQDGLLRDNLTEVVIKPDSAIVGKTLKTAGFRARFDAAVVAVRRDGGRLSGKLGDISIQAGDFLVLAVGNDFAARTNLSKNFYILSGHQPENMLHGWRNISTIGGFISAIAVSVLFSVPLLTCALFYLALLLFTKCLTVNEIKRRFPLEIWMIVLGALTLAKGIENTGLAALMSSHIESLLAGHSVYLVFIAIFGLTLLVTELVTNNAAAALMFPIAYSIALAMGVNVMPFVMAVAFAASGSFISPYGYQTNVMVYNAGNYKLLDFIKFGVPVSLVYSAVVLTVLPRVFPF
ncbi:SLC13 family permease [Endozoicomonas sp. G2_1]|uniref:SLC13 family permease n=1 Tax=Endozoicomonas sp. G2_1 TaxID=2821091 RepID=UPI001ADB2E45|nr:SLC13 family permease [Endozoicomonas sp. G2_1]MBO9488979.1 SLC13 family permease [Endozoicomonas sp. G2_1]